MSTFKTKEDMFASSDDEDEEVVKGGDDGEQKNTKKRKPEGECCFVFQFEFVLKRRYDDDRRVRIGFR